jgi:membrane protease YdiL (CAAX protease family)
METQKTAPRKRDIALALAVFAVAMLMLLFVAAPIQLRFGLTGVVLTEIIILAFAFLGVFLMRRPLREAFPLRRPRLAHSLGSAFTYVGTLLLTLVVSYVLMAIFPGMAEVSSALGDFFTGSSFPLAFLAVAVMPAICEEAMHRGMILSSLRAVRSVRARVLIMGLIFGLFHLDPYRFLPTMLLGMGLSYIMIKTGNFLYPMIFHFVNNLFSLATAFLATGAGFDFDADALAAVQPSGLMFLGQCLTYLSPALLFLYLGIMRLNGLSNIKRTVAMIVLCAVVFVGGYALIAAQVLQDPGYVQMVQDLMDQYAQ